MNIVKTWAQGLQVLDPKHMKLMTEVLKKSIRRAYWLTISQLWYLFIPCIVCVALIESYPEYKKGYGLVGSLFFIITFLYLLGVAKSVRASVSVKDAHYFEEFSLFNWSRTSIVGKLSIICFIVIANIYMKSIVFLFQTGCSYLNFAWWVHKIPLFLLGIYTWVVAPLTALWMLMYWQARPVFGRIFISLWRAQKMILYNYPLIMCAYGLIIGGIYILSWFIGYLGLLVGFSISWRLTIGVLCAPALYALWSTLFIKLWHDQTELYTS